jgi:hypothetical protein
MIGKMRKKRYDREVVNKRINELKINGETNQRSEF